MDSAWFDAWPRRRFGIVAGSAAAALLGLVTSDDGAAKKNKKKRCRKLGQTCQKGGKKRRCCGALKCDAISFEPSTQTRCCRKIGQTCVDNHDCCDALCCAADGACTDFCAQ